MPNTGSGPWTPDEDAWFPAHPDAPYSAWQADHPGTTRTFDAWRLQRKRLLGPGVSRARREAVGTLHRRPETPPEMPPVNWDKSDIDFHWTDVLGPVTALQEMAKGASGSQDRATIHLDTDRPAPVLFISDWHVGSWGTSYQKVAQMTQAIRDHHLYVAVLGDMLQMSIKLRNVLEVSDNLLPPRLQMRFMQSWLEDIAPHVLWCLWDNHVVEREEAVTGFSHFAELFKEKTVYHSGIAHTDLIVGDETYRIATSHRFRGNSYINPTHGQMRYARFEGIDRELIVAGDSHRPAIQTYTDGPLTRIAINCGALQTDSGYAKRYFSLTTHDWMPLVVFAPDQHMMIPFTTLDHYLTGTRAQRPLSPTGD